MIIHDMCTHVQTRSLQTLLHTSLHHSHSNLFTYTHSHSYTDHAGACIPWASLLPVERRGKIWEESSEEMDHFRYYNLPPAVSLHHEGIPGLWVCCLKVKCGEREGGGERERERERKQVQSWSQFWRTFHRCFLPDFLFRIGYHLAMTLSGSLMTGCRWAFLSATTSSPTFPTCTFDRYTSQCTLAYNSIKITH